MGIQRLNLEDSTKGEGTGNVEVDGVCVTNIVLANHMVNKMVPPLLGMAEDIVREIEEHLGHEDKKYIYSRIERRDI